MPTLNRFLYKFALNLPQIRDRLDFTQATLADKAGISKPTIVAIEGDPSRLSRSYALALFMVITSELDQREATVDKIDYSDIAKAIAKLAAVGFTAKTLQVALSAVAVTGAFLMPLAAISAIPFLFRGKFTEKARESIDPATLKTLAEKSIHEIRKEITMLLGLKSLSATALMQEIEKNEPQ